MNDAPLIEHKDEVSMFIDKATVNPCWVHKKLPKFYMINKSREYILVECEGQPGDCCQMGDWDHIVNIWNKNNPLI